MTIEELKNELDSLGLGKHFDTLKPILKNTIRLYLKSDTEENITIANSKIGGQPDLPNDMSWPCEIDNSEEDNNNKPLSFIAQINLKSVASYDKDSLLPKSGMLYFFYSAEQDGWGFDYNDKNQFKVIYYDGDISKLQRVDFPKNLPEYARYKPCSVNIKSEISLPYYGHECYSNFTEEDIDNLFDEIYEEYNISKLLGYSNNIQGEMELECELVTNGLYCGDPSGYNDPKAAILEPNAKDWRLLLQIDSDEDSKMMWGDSGRLYFWIKEKDLVNKNFDKSWFCLQCF